MAEPNPSKIKRLADEEAARAEAPTPDEEQEGEEAEQDEPAAEPEPEPQPQPEPAVEDAVADELAKAQATYLKRVTKIMGGELPWPECPTCRGAGFDLTGGEPEPEYKPSPLVDTCPDCEGLGKVATGSRVPNEEVQPCPTCQGRGFAAKGVVPIAAPELGNVAAGGAGWLGDPNIRPQG